MPAPAETRALRLSTRKSVETKTRLINEKTRAINHNCELALPHTSCIEGELVVEAENANVSAVYAS